MAAVSQTIALVLSLLMATAAFGQSTTGRVVGVHDGDSITILGASNVQHKIRLNGIDAPEVNQAFGAKAKAALSEKVFGRQVTVQVASIDRYGREVGDVYLDSRWINLEMVADGFAWQYVAYSKNGQLAKAEKTARERATGLWKEPSPTPPWLFRKANKEER